MSVVKTCWPGVRCAWFVFGFLVYGRICQAEAHAQACHGPDLDVHEEREQPFRATVAASVATYDVQGYAGNYEGLYASLAYRTPGYGAEVLLPSYRLDRMQGIEYGLGDMIITLRGTFIHAHEGNIALGVELPLMVPTGDATRDLGMGRVMPMPNVHFTMVMRSFWLRAQLGYGKMIGGTRSTQGAQHHGGGGSMKMRSPLVNPMNMSEFEHALLVGFDVQRYTSAHARWWGAVPVADDMGVLRQAVAAGFSIKLSRFDLTIELQRTISGDAFEWKPLLQLGATF